MLELVNGETNYYQLNRINKWTLKEIAEFITMNENMNQKEFLECLKTIYEYNLLFNQVSSMNKEQLHKIGIQNYYQKPKDRNIEELLKEYESLLKEKEMPPISYEKVFLISQKVNKIRQLSLRNNNKTITKETINQPRNLYLKQNEEELIAIINNAIKSLYGYQLRDSQIFSLLVLLDKEPKRGKIAQILTGEGKTIIINCLAIILVLQGHKVDIVTSNPKLAKRDAKESEQLYNYFGISVGHIIEDEEEMIINFFQSENNNVYTKDIIYGTTFYYQGDILRDEYQLTGVRKKRSFDIVIVDEIDSMLIDEYASKTRLAATKPFLEKYSIFLQILWGYYKNLHLDNEDFNNDKELCEKLKEYLIKKITDIINNNGNEFNFYFPMSRQSKRFALDQVNNWVNSLINSLKMKIGVEYIILDKEIVPVDQDNTGIIQKFVMLSYGLHQFLQMKHNLPVTPISITTNFLSNLGFFKRYIKPEKNSIYGMTGTLGSKKARKLLEDIYNLDFDYIPPNSLRGLKELTSSISLDTPQFIRNIIRIVKRETNYGRAILLICESIDSVNELYKELSLNCKDLKLIRIIGKDGEENKIPNLLQGKTVIISTNISGRGTDLKLGNEVINKGGLNVIITFIPNNSRVEEQNYGRAGRKGEPGTWQLVINYKEAISKFLVINDFKKLYLNYKNLAQNLYLLNDTEIDNFMKIFNIQFLRELREKREICILNNAFKFIDKVNKEDHLFNLYCKMIDEKKELREEENKIYLESIEEKWAIFLYNIDLTGKSLDYVNNEFNKFKSTIFTQYRNGTIIDNPGYYNNYVNNKLSLLCDFETEKSRLGEVAEGFKEIASDIAEKFKNLFNKNKKLIADYESYIEKCNSSINLDPSSFIPYYLRAMCKILKGKNGLGDLKMASKLIKEEIERYQYLFNKLKELRINTEFIYHQINLLNNIKIHIIEQNIIDHRNLNSNDLKIKKRSFDDIFSFNNNTGDKENKDRIIPKYLEKYFKSMKDNGLQYFYFIKEKASFFKAALMVGAGLAMIALSICTGGIAAGAIGAIAGAAIGAVFGSSFVVNGLDIAFKGENDNSFPDSYDLGFFDFLKNRKKIRKYMALDIDEICGKYDEKYGEKKLKEEEVNFKNQLIKKIKKLGINNENLKKLNKEENEEEEINKNYINKNYINKNNYNNFNNRLINNKNLNNSKIKKIKQKKEELKKNLNSDEKKCLLAKALTRAAGSDFLENKKGDIYENIKRNKKELGKIAEDIILKKVKDLCKKELDKKADNLKLNLEKISKKEKDFKNNELKLKKELENLDKKINNIKQTNENIEKKVNNFNKNKEKQNEDAKEMEIIAKRIINGESSQNTIINFGNKINNMKLQEMQSNQEKEKIIKDIENNNKNKGIIKKEIDEHNQKAQNFENEKLNLNEYIEKHNKKCENYNEYVKEFNNLKKI